MNMDEININLREEQLRDLQKYIKDIDKDITLILQSLQWDRKHLQQGKQMVVCKYDSNHRILEDKAKEHEEKCYIKSQNYVPGDSLFPEPLDANAVTIVKLSTQNINDIISYAAKTDPSFKRSSELDVTGHAPLTLGRLQATYTADERRVLYDAVAASAPPLANPHISDSDPVTDDPVAKSAHAVSRHEALGALRDARRRRARHRRAAPAGYRHQLRGLISAQMESISGKWNDDDEDIELDVRNDEPDDGRLLEDENYHGRNEVKHLKPNRRELRVSGEDKRKEYGRAHRDHEKKKYERDNREVKRGEYERENREDGRRHDEYNKKCRERKNVYAHGDRKRQRYDDKKYLEIKQEKDDYPADKLKREERNYDYKDRKRERERSSSRDNKEYHKRERKHHKHKSAERYRDRSREREYNRNNKDIIDCSYLKIKNEPLDYENC